MASKVGVENPESFGLESGQIVAGRPYVPPPVDPLHITKEAYIPLEFAQAKVVEVTTDMHTLKTAYENYLVRLKEYFQNADANTKVHYENYIAQLKEKARKRITHEQELGKKREAELQDEISNKDSEMDELRDLNATRISEYQVTIHSLKQKMTEAEQEHTLNVMVRKECSVVLAEVLLGVESVEVSRVKQSLINELNTEKESQQQEYVRMQKSLENDKQNLEREKQSLEQEMEAVREHELIVKSAHEADGIARRQVEEHLREMLFHVERSSYAGLEQEHAVMVADLKKDLLMLQEQNADLTDRERSLREEVEKCREQIAESHASADSSVQALQKQCEEYIDAVGVQKDNNTKLKEELKKRASALHAVKKDSIFSGVTGAMDAMLSRIEQSDAKKQIKKLTAQVKSEHSRNRQLAETIEKLKEEIDSKNKQLVSTERVPAAAALAAPVAVDKHTYGAAAEKDASGQSLETQPAVVVASSPEVVGMSAADYAACESEKQDMLDQLQTLATKLNGLNTALADAEEASSRDATAKADTKNDIKIWMKNFERENGRIPNNEDKSAVKDKFVAHKIASAAAVESAAEVDRIHTSISQTEDIIYTLEERLSELTAKMEANPPIVVGPTSAELPGGVDPEAVKEFENTIAALQNDKATLQDEVRTVMAQVKTVEGDKASLATLLENIRNERRTDVVARLEDENDALQKEINTQLDLISTLKIERTKNETKIAELKERAETAEAELKERDAADLRTMTKDEETAVLKSQVTKQRDEIVMKKKAATAGWDAAADAEEKLDTQVEKAYKKGLNEGKKIAASDMEALNDGLELKEQRIVVLLEKAAMAERASQNAADQRDAALQQAAEAAAALSEARTKLSISGGAGGGGGGGPQVSQGAGDLASEEAMAAMDQLEIAADKAKEELEEARESLNEAQEEVISLSEEVELLQDELRTAQKKIAILEKLAATAVSGGSGGASVAAASMAASGDSNLLDELVTQVRVAIEKGTALWNEQKRDDCCDLYVQTATIISSQLRTPALRDPLAAAVATAKEQPKRRGAVVLRKALDVFMADVQNNDKRSAEIGMHSSSKSKVSIPTASDAASSSELDDLKLQLSSLNDSSKPSKTSGMASGGGNASLLKRAKTAEEQVTILRKQLAEAERAASRTAGPSGKGSGGPVGGGAVDPVEIRKLQKRIKELEMGAAAGGGGNAAADKKALAAAEKKFEKQMKETEKATRKEKAGLESRVSSLEKELETTGGSLRDAVTERDQLRQRVKELGNANAEMEKLRAKADMVDTLNTELTGCKAEVVQITAQYKKEAQLRKKYKNELEDLKGAIRVYARVRPLAQYEIDRNCEKIVAFPDETSVTVQTGRGPKEFEFDAAFTEYSTQDEVFEDTKRLVESMLDGYNVCLFAYGQTGSGKTFTMTGSPTMPGLTPRSIEEMFRLIHERPHCTTRISTYFVELYNDQIVDLYWLLDNKRSRGEPPKLDIKLDAKKMVYVKNSIVKEAANAEELMELFRLGNMERHVGATKMNAESSRSHSIFAVLCESYDSHTKKTVTGKLSLVDLAGSERADKTGAGAERLREAQSINKSLSALGDVISALSEGEKFIPYRNNKLTQLMQDSLGGNAKTLMFVNFSPADYNADETVTSLSYATRVKKITNNASKQAESEEIARLKAIIHKLQHGHAIVDDDGEDGGGGESEHK